MDELVQLMSKALADTFAMYLKSHNFHWNVKGPNFPQYHGFLGDLYDELHGAVDPIAEHIRTLDAFAPGSMARFLSLTSIAENNTEISAAEMFTQLQADNQTVLNSLIDAEKLATRFSEVGLSNFLQDRIDTHKKHAWMLKSINKGA